MKKAMAVGIQSIVPFPAIKDELKTPDAKECFNENGLVQRAVKTIKDNFPELSVITDVALDPYNSDGHDGLVSEDGIILNDATLTFCVNKPPLMQKPEPMLLLPAI